jgi:GDP-4-dehydro-6-deoxy-D-mannose reductase
MVSGFGNQNMLGNRTLITGIRGFCGRHLSAHLARQGYAVFGIDIAPGRSIPSAKVYTGDICDQDFVRETILAIRPSYIFHLAALITARAGLDALHNVNVLGTDHILKVVRMADLDSVILIPGSSAAYGLVEPDDLPVRESQLFRPLDAYAVSKIAQEMLAYTYYARYDLKVVRARTFNVMGPGEPSSLVCSAFAKQIAEIEAAQIEPVLRVGNLTSQRDFVDVRDVVRAYRLLVQRGRPGEVYNICSGLAVSIEACLNELLAMARTPIRVKQDPARMRPSDVPVSVGDRSLLYSQTGWGPTTPLKQSLADLLDDWRRRIQEA